MTSPAQGATHTRLMALAAAAVLAELLCGSRDLLAPWEPLRDEAYFTASGQEAVVLAALEGHREGRSVPHMILADTGEVAGRITLNTIVRGALQSCSVGYWVGAAHNGRGLATRAVGRMTRLAFDDLGLHRVEASTSPDNLRSQRVLERNGFTRYGYAPDYLHIAGRWQDATLYQLVTPDPRPPTV